MRCSRNRAAFLKAFRKRPKCVTPKAGNEICPCGARLLKSKTAALGMRRGEISREDPQQHKHGLCPWEYCSTCPWFYTRASGGPQGRPLTLGGGACESSPRPPHNADIFISALYSHPASQNTYRVLLRRVFFSASLTTQRETPASQQSQICSICDLKQGRYSENVETPAAKRSQIVNLLTVAGVARRRHKTLLGFCAPDAPKRSPHEGG